MNALVVPNVNADGNAVVAPAGVFEVTHIDMRAHARAELRTARLHETNVPSYEKHAAFARALRQMINAEPTTGAFDRRDLLDLRRIERGLAPLFEGRARSHAAAIVALRARRRFARLDADAESRGQAEDLYDWGHEYGATTDADPDHDVELRRWKTVPVEYRAAHDTWRVSVGLAPRYATEFLALLSPLAILPAAAAAAAGAGAGAGAIVASPASVELARSELERQRLYASRAHAEGAALLRECCASYAGAAHDSCETLLADGAAYDALGRAFLARVAQRDGADARSFAALCSREASAIGDACHLDADARAPDAWSRVPAPRACDLTAAVLMAYTLGEANIDAALECVLVRLRAALDQAHEPPRNLLADDAACHAFWALACVRGRSDAHSPNHFTMDDLNEAHRAQLDTFSKSESDTTYTPDARGVEAAQRALQALHLARSHAANTRAAIDLEKQRPDFEAQNSSFRKRDKDAALALAQLDSLHL